MVAKEQMISEMEMAKQQYQYAQDSDMGIRQAKDRMLNLAWNYYDALLAALKENADLQEQLDSMEAALLATSKPSEPAKKKKGGE